MLMILNESKYYSRLWCSSTLVFLFFISGQEIFTELKRRYQGMNCHFLEVASTSEAGDPKPAMVEHWLGQSHRYIIYSHKIKCERVTFVYYRFSNAEVRQEGVGMTVVTTASSIQQNTPVSAPPPAVKETQAQNQPNVEHPLMSMGESGEERAASPTINLASSSGVQLKPVTKKNIVRQLTMNEIDRLKRLVNEYDNFLIHSTII